MQSSVCPVEFLKVLQRLIVGVCVESMLLCSMFVCSHKQGEVVVAVP